MKEPEVTFELALEHGLIKEEWEKILKFLVALQLLQSLVFFCNVERTLQL